MTSTIWSQEDPLFSVHLSRSQHNSHEHLQMGYYAGFKRGGVFEWSLVLLYSTCHIVLSLFSRIVFSVARMNRVVFEINLHLLTRA